VSGGPVHRSRFLAACLLLSACGGPGADHGPLARVTRETLPGGAVSVISDGPTAWRDSSGWRLVESSRITGGDSVAGLIRPGDVALDAAGRLYVADAEPDVIKVYDRAGKFLHTIGRAGEGPGEYRSIRLGVVGPNLVVHDPQLARTSVFDTSGALIRSWRSICCDFSSIQVDREGRIGLRIHVGDRQQDAFVRYTLAGAVADTLVVPRDGDPKYIEFSDHGGMSRMSIRDAPAQLSTLTPDGLLLHGWTADYRLVASRTGPDTALVFGRRTPRVEIPAAVRQARYEEMATNLTRSHGAAAVARVFSPSDIPRYAAAVQYVEGDRSGYRWVNVYTADSLHRLYDVFDSAGVYLGPVRTPWGRGHGAAYWGADEVVVTGENADGLPEVIRYRIDRTMHP
jgi:hypothetical protein